MDNVKKLLIFMLIFCLADPCVLLGSGMLAPPGLTDTGVEGIAEAFTETPGLYPVYLEKTGNDTWIAETGKGRKTFITVKAGSTSPKKYTQQLRGIYHSIKTDESIERIIERSLHPEIYPGESLVTVFLMVEPDVVAGAYTYEPERNIIKVLAVEESYRGTGAVDIMFEDMKKRLFKGDNKEIVEGFLARESPRVDRREFRGTLGMLKIALGIKSRVTMRAAGAAEEYIPADKKPLPTIARSYRKNLTVREQTDAEARIDKVSGLLSKMPFKNIVPFLVHEKNWPAVQLALDRISDDEWHSEGEYFDKVAEKVKAAASDAGDSKEVENTSASWTEDTDDSDEVTGYSDEMIERIQEVRRCLIELEELVGRGSPEEEIAGAVNFVEPLIREMAYMDENELSEKLSDWLAVILEGANEINSRQVRKVRKMAKKVTVDKATRKTIGEHQSGENTASSL